MGQQAPGRARLERDVAEVAGTNYAHQVQVWQAIGILMELCAINERSAFEYLCQRATIRELSPAELATKMTQRQELP